MIVFPVVNRYPTGSIGLLKLGDRVDRSNLFSCHGARYNSDLVGFVTYRAPTLYAIRSSRI
jgi:hypothetical protein